MADATKDNLMKFKATEDQVKQMAANAVNAAQPVGLGVLHFENKEYGPEQFKIINGGLYLDYVAGRMTKLAIRNVGTDRWEIGGEPRVDYQSWAVKYPSNKALIESVGAELE